MKSYVADYNSRPIEIADGNGCYVFDRAGKRYIDFVGAWCVSTVGWKCKEVAEAVMKEVGRGIAVPPVFRFSEWESFAKTLVENAPGRRGARAFRCTSGSDAVEFPCKCARAATGRKKIISIEHVYHGHTYGAASVGDACTKAMGPCLPGFIKLSMPNPYRGGNSAKTLGQLEGILKNDDDIAAFFSEPVWTNAGAIIPPKDFYPALESICRKYGILLVMDEVATGFGRCGKLFASELWNIKPDIMCLAKGLSGGYGTIGATLVSEEIFAKCAGIPDYSTFGWLPIDLAGAKANVEIVLREKLWENAEKVGGHILARLKALESLPFVGEARGIGLLFGIEIVSDKKTKTADVEKARQFQDECSRRGLLVETSGNVLFMSPPLELDEALADEGIAILESVLKGQ